MRPSNNMRNHAQHHVSLILALLVLIGAATLGPGPAAFTAGNSAPIWSAPVNLGSAINSTASDQGPAISPDGLSLYFTSNRTGGLGGFDMYVSQRASISDPWGSPVNLGPALNTASDEGNPAFSLDGRFLFFQSKRPGGLGGIDIWVAQRNNIHDDFSWQPAVNLGSGVNSADDDNGPTYFDEDDARGARQLYFGSTRPGGLGAADIYVSNQMADRSFGPATLVTELSSPLNENRPSIRRDGLEIFFQSNRAGSNGTAADLWVATRGSTADAWSTPVNLGDTINTTSVEQNAYLSSDGMTLFFSSDRPGGFGGLDLYLSTRTSVPGPSWTITGNLNTGRQFQTETLLPNGKVLVAGGTDSNRSFKSAELYDPATGTWNRTADLNTDRNTHTATLLQNGKVLVAGGFSCGPPPQSCFALNSAELYDPDTGTWSVSGNLNIARDGHTATLLPNGKVLIVSGDINRNSAELYDPNTGTWSNTGNLNTGRDSHTATLLQNGKVLVAGGLGASIDLNSAELYDPDTGIWSNTGNLNTARELHTATLLSNGKVLVAGGFVNFSLGQVTNSAELYDPDTGIWSSTGNLNQRRAFHTATLLTGGKVLVAGGFFIDGLPDITNRAELYDPATGTWSGTATLNMHRRFHTATLLLSGKVLAAGGNGFNAPNSAELYDPATTAGPNTVQFSSSSYTVSEGSPRVDITLSRSGDTTSSASVSFATNDAAGLTNCNVNNGIASPRCDYINTLGAITFAAGETSRSFSVAIVDDSYAEGNETFAIGLNSPSGATLGAQSTATVMITDNDSSNGANPIDSTNFFVRQQYIDFLGREPDPPGFNGWVGTINNCTGDTTQCDRIHVSQQFFQSEEFQTRGYFVYRFYLVAFGRKPEYGEFVPDLARVSGFLDANQLEAAKVAFIADFMARPAFANQYNSLSNTAYVDALINTAAVNSPNRQALIDSLNNNTATRAQVLRQIVESSEVSTKYNHQAFAVMEYFGYLRRQPDAFYLDWITVLDQTNDPRGMVTGFVNSTEYRQRFGP